MTLLPHGRNSTFDPWGRSVMKTSLKHDGEYVNNRISKL